MKKKFTSFIVAVVCLLSASVMQAQPELTFWAVDQVHLQDHSKGIAVEWPNNYNHYFALPYFCGEVMSFDIENSGDQPLILERMPFLQAGAYSGFEVQGHMASMTIEPGTAAHFDVVFDAPQGIESGQAMLEIRSNDPNQPTFLTGLEVGANPRGFVEFRDENDTPIPIGQTIDFEEEFVGQTKNKSFKFVNTDENFPVIVYSCNVNPCEPVYGVPVTNIRSSQLDGISDFTTSLDDAFGTFQIMLEPEGSQDFTIDFTPSEAGPRSGTFCFNYILLRFPDKETDALSGAQLRDDSDSVGESFNYPLNGVGVEPVAEDLPAMNRWGMLLLSLLIVSVGAYVVVIRK